MAGSRRGPEPRISHEAVLEAARRLPRHRLTMRALGRELGVTHAALYRYFPDLQAVLAALGADMAESLTPPSDDLSWQDWLRETARLIRQVCLSHPEVGTPVTWPVVLPATTRLIGTGLTVLTRTFSTVDALTALSLVSRVAEGFARSELAARRPTPPLSSELERTLVDAGLEAAIDYDADAAFERELDIVVAGIDASLPKKAREGR